MTGPIRRNVSMATTTAVALAMSAAAHGGGPPVFYVDASAAPGGDGGSWGSAFQDLHMALDAAAIVGDAEIWVAWGEYAPAPPGGDPDDSYHLVDGVTILGGFAGFERSADERDPAANPTVITGDLNGDDLPGGVNIDDNAYRCFFGQSVSGAIIDGLDFVGYGSGVHIIDSEVLVRDCVFVGKRYKLSPYGLAPAIDSEDGLLSIHGCRFEDNVGEPSGGVTVTGGSLDLRGSVFVDNEALGPGAMFTFDADEIVVRDCDFIGNHTSTLGGALLLAFAYDDLDSAYLARCRFINNTSSFHAGAVMTQTASSTFVDCIFSRNEAAETGGAVDISTGEHDFIGCTFAGNDAGNGASVIDTSAHSLRNCVIWGNASPVFSGANPAFSSLIQGGHDGSINADPLFVQPGVDDLRLGLGSPALNAGDNNAVPMDIFDLDDDGDTSEPLPYDLAGADRIQERFVDLGAYEGAFETLPPAAEESNFDPGDIAVLIPSGLPFDPLAVSATFSVNSSQQENASMNMSEDAATAGSQSVRYVTFDASSLLQTSLGAGEHYSRVYLPFTQADLPDGAAPESVNLVRWDELAQAWVEAPYANTAPSPDHDGPIGDRLVEILGGGDEWTLSPDLGDYGVVWSPATGQGFVWANVDVDGRYAVAAPQCLADVNADGDVDALDVEAIFASWGATGGAADVTLDGAVNAADLAAVLANTGGCHPDP